MKTLTIHAPWAWAIMQGYKRVENRTWNTHYRGPLAIHAGNSMKSDAEARALFANLGIGSPDEFPRGVILGSVDLVNVLRTDELVADPFAVGPYCLILANPQLLADPIPAKGALSFWQSEVIR